MKWNSALVFKKEEFFYCNMFITKGNCMKVQNLSLSVSLCHRKAVVRRRNSSTFLHRLSFQLSFFQMRKVQKSQPLYLKLGLSANFSFYVFLSISVHHCTVCVVQLQHFTLHSVFCYWHLKIAHSEFHYFPLI